MEFILRSEAWRLRRSRLGPWAALLLVGLALAGPLPPGAAEGSDAPVDSPTYVSRIPILIVGDAGFNTSNGVTGGAGTPGDPYVLSGWRIDARDAAGIDVRDTTASFVIREVLVENGSAVEFYPGVALLNVSHAAIEGSLLRANTIGVRVVSSSDVRIAATDFEDNEEGLWALSARNVSLADVRITGSQIGIQADGVGGLVASRLEVHGSVSSGIDLADVRGASFEDLNVSTSWTGLVGYRVDGLSIRNGTFHLDNFAGLTLQDAQNVSVAGSRFLGDGGIYAAGGRNVSLVDSLMASSRGRAVDLVGVAGVRIEGNTILGPAEGGLRLSGSSNVSLARTTFEGAGLLLEGSAYTHYASHSIADDNVVNGKPLLFRQDCAGWTVDGVPAGQVFAVNCTGVRIANVAILDSDVGIEFAYVTGATIEGVDLRGHLADAIRLERSTDVLVDSFLLGEGRGGGLRSSYGFNVTLRDGTIRLVDAAVRAGWPTWLTVERTTISAAYSGVLVTGGWDVAVRNSSIAFGLSGIELSQVDRAQITGTTLTNTTFGVDLVGSWNVRVWGNAFENATFPGSASGGASNAWDAGYPVGGNYWSSYAGWDDCSAPSQDACTGPDGIGDVPYAAGEGVVDRYPLMRSWSPNVLPVAAFVWSPHLPRVGELVAFEAYGSYDPDENGLSYSWDFGDGAAAEGYGVTHAYLAEGGYNVTLRVVDGRGGLAADTTEVLVGFVRPPPVSLYDHPAGFRIPVPEDWIVVRDVVINGTPIELRAIGPDQEGVLANLIVNVVEDPEAEESAAYLLGVMEESLEDAAVEYPNVYLADGPYLGSVSGHPSIRFSVRYAGTTIAQEITVVASAAHDRVFGIIFTYSTTRASEMGLLYVAIEDGFEITLSSPPTTGPPSVSLGSLLLFGILAGIVAGIVVMLAVRRKRPMARPPSGGPVSGAVSASLGLGDLPPGEEPRPARESVGSCAGCGASLHPGARFCQVCGRLQ